MQHTSRAIVNAVMRGFHSSPPRSASAGPGSSSSLWSRYSDRLESHPVSTKSLTSGGIAFFGDVLSQNLLNTDGKDFDFGRLLRYSVLGSCFVGPTLHYWYGFLAKKVPGVLLRDSIQRLLIDQFIFSPFFSAVFISLIMTLDGQADKVHILNRAFTT